MFFFSMKEISYEKPYKYVYDKILIALYVKNKNNNFGGAIENYTY